MTRYKIQFSGKALLEGLGLEGQVFDTVHLQLIHVCDFWCIPGTSS